MHILHAVILGLVEGITEYLPVSSTGHLIITSALLGLKDPASKDAIDAFEIVIQGGAILAVVGLYWPRFVQMLRGLTGADPAGFRLLTNVLVAFVPAAGIAFFTHKWITAHLFLPVPVVAALIIGGVYMIVVEYARSGRIARVRSSMAGKEIDDLNITDALKIGLLQIIALWPGTSRSMMTITGGYLVGLRPKAAAEFSFLLGVPTLLTACAYAIYKDLKDARAHHTQTFYETLGTGPVLVGVLVAALAAAVAVKWLVGFLGRHGLAPFGVYRIILGVMLTGLILGQIVRIEPAARADSAGATPTPVATPNAAPAMKN